MPARFQWKRTKKKFDNIELDNHSLRFGEPLYFDNTEDPSEVALVIGDSNNTPITQLPRFTPLPPDKEGMVFNDVYFIQEGTKYYFVDKHGNKISGAGMGSGSSVSTYRGTILSREESWEIENNYYHQDVDIPSIQEKNPTTIDVELTKVTDYNNILFNWNYIVKAETYNGGIRFYAYSLPKINLNFQAQVVNNDSGLFVRMTATILQNWTQVDNYYIQEIALQNVRAVDNSTIDLVVDMNNYQDQLKQWSKIIKIETEEGKIKVYASEPTTIDLPIQMFVYTVDDITT